MLQQITRLLPNKILTIKVSVVEAEVLEVIGAGTLAGAIPELPAAIIKKITVVVLGVIARGAVATVVPFGVAVPTRVAAL